MDGSFYVAHPLGFVLRICQSFLNKAHSFVNSTYSPYCNLARESSWIAQVKVVQVVVSARAINGTGGLGVTEIFVLCFLLSEHALAFVSNINHGSWATFLFRYQIFCFPIRPHSP